MSGELAELWAWGFDFGGRRYPWGTLVEALPEVRIRGGEAHGLPTIAQSAGWPAPERPVTAVLFQIAAEARLFEDGPLAELRARLDADLGPGEHTDSEHGPEKTGSRWRLDGATVWLDVYPSAWGFDSGRSSGRLSVAVDRERVAEPYLSEFRAGAEVPPGEVEVIPAPGLRVLPWRQQEIQLALSRPDLRAPPGWVRVGDGEVGIWRQGGTLGIATRFYSIADPPVLRHIRWAPARGSGYATLDAGPDRDLLSTGPGEAGLDEVVARLSAHGLQVDKVEEKDWG